MKKKAHDTALPAVLFIGLLTILSLWNALTPQRAFSDMENRTLAQFHAVSLDGLRTGQWMSSFEEYTSDQFLFRDGFMRIKTAADLALQRKDNGSVYFGKNDYLFTVDKLDEKQEAANLSIVSSFLQQARAQQPDIRLSVLLAPTAKSVLAELLPPFAPVSDERSAVEKAEAVLTQSDSSLIFTDPFAALFQAAHAMGTEKESPSIYYRTDHHWTTDGAYTAYCSWAEDNGFSPVPPDQFQRHIVSNSFQGTNQSKAPGVHIQPDRIVTYTLNSSTDFSSGSPIQVTVWKDITKPESSEERSSLYDESFLETKDQYAYFLGGNDPQVRICTSVKNGRRLLLIKDSYANCMVPFLALHYEEIIITDLRYSHGKLIRSNESDDFTDILFLYNAESFFSDRNLAYLTQLRF